MLNFGEYPNVENASTLSAILEMDVPDKYFLSAKACWGIIRRAESRQKEIPIILKVALLERIAEVKRFCPVPEIRHKEWKKRGLMPPMKPEETPEFSFSDLQMTLYNTIYI